MREGSAAHGQERIAEGLSAAGADRRLAEVLTAEEVVERLAGDGDDRGRGVQIARG